MDGEREQASEERMERARARELGTDGERESVRDVVYKSASKTSDAIRQVPEARGRSIYLITQSAYIHTCTHTHTHTNTAH